MNWIENHLLILVVLTCVAWIAGLASIALNTLCKKVGYKLITFIPLCGSAAAFVGLVVACIISIVLKITHVQG